MSSFSYKKILVVGGTSGIGEALASKFISEGSSVVVVGRRQDKLDSFVSSHGSDKASAISLDITDLASIPSFASRVTKEHPDLDFVLVNSGIQRGFDFTRPDTVDFSVIDEEFKTNYISYIHLTMAFLPFLQEQSKSKAVGLAYTTSGLALTPILRCANYCASKAALHHWIMVLREQLKDSGSNIKVIELLPPAVQTELHDQKHQPDIENGRQIGIPLEEYIDETWKGLSGGKDSVPVGMAAKGYAPDGFETKRQQAFHGMIAQMKKSS